MRWADFGGWFGRRKAPTLGFCTLAIHAPYRRRARLLCADLAPAPMLVLTDEPAYFADLPVRTLLHRPTGPMASDYSRDLLPAGNNQGGPPTMTRGS